MKTVWSGTPGSRRTRMKIVVIGATRGTGKHVVDQALERGDGVLVQCVHDVS